MDFLFSSDSNMINRMAEVLKKFAVNDPTKCIYKFTGEWGCLAATPSTYFGLEPCETNDWVGMVLGDPLCPVDPVDNYKNPSARTEAIFKYWQNQTNAVNIQLNHPSAILKVCKNTNSVEVITDAGGSIPIYATEDELPTFLGSSPDLIALVYPCHFDRLSAIERICSWQITFPNTLYTNVKEIPPSSITRFSVDERKSVRWWNPPLQDTETPQHDWAQLLENSIQSTITAIANQVSRSGMVTVSAGLDSRYLLSLITREKLLDVTGINLAATPNMKSAVAEQIAKRFNVPIKLQQRRIDHYSKVLLNGHPEIGTNVNLIDAHFAEKGLGDTGEVPFIMGAYMADTVLSSNDVINIAHKKHLRKKRFNSSTPNWVTSPLYRKFDLDDLTAITERRNKAEQTLGLTDGHCATMRRIYPLTRAATKGHFEAARRSYPIYEPFMTRSCIELSFLLPERTKERSNKQEFYGDYLNSAADIPSNPNPSRLVKILAKISNRLAPKQLRPEKFTSGEWEEIKGPMAPKLRRVQRNAKDTLSKKLGVNLLNVKNSRTTTLITTTSQALERCNRPD